MFEGFVSKYDTALSKMTDTIVAEAEKESAHAEAIAKGFDAKIAESTARVQAAEAIISTPTRGSPRRSVMQQSPRKKLNLSGLHESNSRKNWNHGG